MRPLRNDSFMSMSQSLPAAVLSNHPLFQNDVDPAPSILFASIHLDCSHCKNLPSRPTPIQCLPSCPSYCMLHSYPSSCRPLLLMYATRHLTFPLTSQHLVPTPPMPHSKLCIHPLYSTTCTFVLLSPFSAPGLVRANRSLSSLDIGLSYFKIGAPAMWKVITIDCRLLESNDEDEAKHLTNDALGVEQHET